MDYSEFIRARQAAYRAFLANRPPLPPTILGARDGGIPAASNIPPGSTFFEQTVVTSAGVLNIQQPGSSLIGRLNDTETKSIVRVYDLPGTIAYSQTQLEVGDATAILRSGFEKLFNATELSMAAFAIEGSPRLQIYGLKTHPNASEYVIEANGTGTSADWSDKTSALVYQDVVKFLNFAESQSRPFPITNVLLGGDVSAHLQGTVYSADGTLFLSQVINNNMATRLNPPRVTTIPELSGMIAFSNSLVRFELVEDFQPFEHSMEGAQLVLGAGVTIAGIFMDTVGAITYADVTI